MEPATKSAAHTAASAVPTRLRRHCPSIGHQQSTSLKARGQSSRSTRHIFSHLAATKPWCFVCHARSSMSEYCTQRTAGKNRRSTLQNAYSAHHSHHRHSNHACDVLPRGKQLSKVRFVTEQAFKAFHNPFLIIFRYLVPTLLVSPTLNLLESWQTW